MEPRIDIEKYFDKLKGMFTIEQTVRRAGWSTR